MNVRATRKPPIESAESGFNLRSFLLTPLKALQRMSPLKKTELPRLYFGEGASPFDLLLKPCGTLRDRNPSIKAVRDKTIIEYLFDLPQHMGAIREVLAFNLILHPEESQRFTLPPEIVEPGEKLSENAKQAILAQYHTRPLIFLKKVGAVNERGQMREDLKLDVRDYFHFDFDEYKSRVEKFREALRKRDIPSIREGVKLLGEMKKMYGDVIKRLYSLGSDDAIAVNSVDELYAPFRQVLGAIAWRLQQGLKALIIDSKPDEIAK